MNKRTKQVGKAYKIMNIPRSGHDFIAALRMCAMALAEKLRRIKCERGDHI